MNLDLPVTFYILLPVIAALYASVGHGGASGYLALMALFNADTTLMRPTALLLNLFVAGISFYFYRKSGHFRWKLFWPFAIASIPAAFIGGYIDLDPLIYKRILGILLLFSVLRLSGILGKHSGEIRNQIVWQSIVVGLLIGLFSGLIGIGGGIILSPVILLLHWADMKETAAVSALFIWVNSLAGILGVTVNGFTFDTSIWLLVILAFVGGTFGAYAGSLRIPNLALKRLLAFVLLLASFKLLMI